MSSNSSMGLNQDCQNYQDIKCKYGEGEPLNDYIDSRASIEKRKLFGPLPERYCSPKNGKVLVGALPELLKSGTGTLTLTVQYLEHSQGKK